MSKSKMHDYEIETNETLVRQLLYSQFTKWANLPIKKITSDGTVNIIYRLGNDMCIRLPRIPEASPQIKKEQQWLPYLASHLPLTIPEPLGIGNPERGYPYHWSIYRWIEGNNAAIQPLAEMDQTQAAIDLAQFINALHKIDSTDGPLSSRGGPLENRNIEVLKAIESLHGIIDTQSATTEWEACLKAQAWNRPPVWTHSDLLPANLLIKQGRIAAVIDFGMLGIGDPACDLIPAWGLFSAKTRKIFRASLVIDDETWVRGRGWALSIGLIILPYYLHSNPGIVAVGKHLINEILADLE